MTASIDALQLWKFVWRIVCILSYFVIMRLIRRNFSNIYPLHTYMQVLCFLNYYISMNLFPLNWFVQNKFNNWGNYYLIKLSKYDKYHRKHLLYKYRTKKCKKLTDLYVFLTIFEIPKLFDMLFIWMACGSPLICW